MKFSVNLTDDLITQIDALAQAAGITKAEWVRAAITQVCTQAASSTDTQAPPSQHPDNTHLEEEIKRLESLLEERAMRIEDLKTSEDKLVAQAERYQVLLQGAQQALPPPRRSFWDRLLGRSG